jgi:hypothetical protein
VREAHRLKVRSYLILNLAIIRLIFLKCLSNWRNWYRMTSWEFLLQKKGDKSWLPLESPTLEVLEGQYRLASRSDFFNAAIDIHIDYLPSPEANCQPLKHQVNKQVSSEGLLMLIPYTTFNPGIWQISCRNGSSWHKNLQIEVLPCMVELDWDNSALPESQNQVVARSEIKEIEIKAIAPEILVTSVASASPVAIANSSNTVTTESNSPTYREFPLLPFESIPPNVKPIKRNIKLPELPKFLGFGKARNLPPWNSARGLNAQNLNYYELEEDLHYEFEDELMTISKPSSGIVHLAKYRAGVTSTDRD